jgi:hypothetical protein
VTNWRRCGILGDPGNYSGAREGTWHGRRDSRGFELLGVIASFHVSATPAWLEMKCVSFHCK